MITELRNYLATVAFCADKLHYEKKDLPDKTREHLRRIAHSSHYAGTNPAFELFSKCQTYQECVGTFWSYQRGQFGTPETVLDMIDNEIEQLRIGGYEITKYKQTTKTNLNRIGADG